MKISIFFLILLSTLLVSCGKNNGNAVPAGSGSSPIPSIKANCNDSSCV